MLQIGNEFFCKYVHPIYFSSRLSAGEKNYMVKRLIYVFSLKYLNIELINNSAKVAFGNRLYESCEASKL